MSFICQYVRYYDDYCQFVGHESGPQQQDGPQPQAAALLGAVSSAILGVFAATRITWFSIELIVFGCLFSAGVSEPTCGSAGDLLLTELCRL